MNPVYVLIPIFIVLLGMIFSTNQYNALEFLMLLFFMIIIYIIGANYFFGVQLTAVLNHLFDKPQVDVDISQPVEPVEPSNSNDQDDKKTYPPQTYHVQGKFNYNEAKAVCKAYNGKLASLKHLEHAYRNGAEWCDYGWSDDRMALYPTQYDTWVSYQGTPDEKRCGIPGVNGGYNMNINQHLGANCFGKKPDGKMPPAPAPATTIDSKAQEWLNKNLTIAPFNYNEWSV
jgi:hypothetical protein